MVALIGSLFGVHNQQISQPTTTPVVQTQAPGNVSNSSMPQGLGLPCDSDKGITTDSINGPVCDESANESAMSKYSDSGFGFSFWYPSGWHVAKDAVDNSTKYPGGTVTNQITVANGQRVITIEEFTSFGSTITDSTGVGACPVCSTVRYYFDFNQHTWMAVYPDGVSSGRIAPGVPIAANVSTNTMGGLHMLAGSQRFGANVIIPLSAQNFLIVTVDGAIATESSDAQALAKTILALDPSVATPVSQAQQNQTIRAESAAYSNLYGASSNTGSAIAPNPNLNTYDNFGISFQYPVEWGIPKENFYGNGLGSIYFNYGSSAGQPFEVFIEQDTNPQGSGLLNETFDAMIARFRTNDQYIYQQKSISADGIQGVELFYNSMV